MIANELRPGTELANGWRVVDVAPPSENGIVITIQERTVWRAATDCRNCGINELTHVDGATKCFGCGDWRPDEEQTEARQVWYNEIEVVK